MSTNVSQVAGNSCTEAPEQGRTCLRIIESFELEEAPKGHLVQLPRNKQGHLQLHQVLSAPSSLTLRASRYGAATASLGILFQCLATLIVTNIFLIVSLQSPL